VVAAALLVLWLFGRQFAIAAPIPARLSDQEFWKFIVDASESDQPFRSNGAIRTDNLISNERGFQVVIPAIAGISKPGAYLGVGPEQNFSYIAALKPSIAFIIDIRRDNLRLQLLYKALFEMANDRAEFLSLLFARPRPPNVSVNTTVNDLFAAFRGVQRSDALAKSTLASVLARLKQTHGFTLSVDDEKSITNAYGAFARNGGNLKWDDTGAAWIPTYAELMTETDGRGANKSYLASEANFQVLKHAETDNRVIPIVGDFAGRRALPAVARYLHEHDTPVSAFYTSNVQQYLSADQKWRPFVSNLAAFPMDAKSLMILTVFAGTGFGRAGPEYQTTTWIAPMKELVDDVARGRAFSYQDVLRRSMSVR
jgi:hypothetical protein